MKSKQVLNTMLIVSSIIFIGLCIKFGAIIISFFVGIFVNKLAIKDIYLGLDMSKLYDFSETHYIIFSVMILIISALKVYIFYLVITFLSNINLKKPFSLLVVDLMMKISYLSLAIGIMSILTNAYYVWLLKKGIFFQFNIGSSGFLFMAGIIFIIAYIFKQGIIIQSENELTI